jgi:hypothetical protein
MIRTVTATRYVTPLREGGSLPAVVEADDDGTYVLKFRGAGQGARALIAELVAGELGRALGLPVPEIVFAELDPALGRTEPDPEIQALLLASAGLNLALDFLPGALAYTPTLEPPDPDLAALIVWFDAYVTNVDRTPRNPNLLHWGGRLWLIDHGAALYFHHAWDGAAARRRARFPQIRDHILLPYAGDLATADAVATARLTPGAVERIAGLIPDAWLGDEPRFASPAEQRAAYAAYLLGRLEPPRAFVEEALHAARAQRL